MGLSRTKKQKKKAQKSFLCFGFGHLDFCGTKSNLNPMGIYIYMYVWVNISHTYIYIISIYYIVCIYIYIFIFIYIYGLCFHGCPMSRSLLHLTEDF